MPFGSGTASLPLGPCTSTQPGCKAIFTPLGTTIGLRPIRDIRFFLTLQILAAKTTYQTSQSSSPPTRALRAARPLITPFGVVRMLMRSEEHTSELQSLAYLVCRLLLEKKNKYEY